MFYQHHQLLLADETLETRVVWISVVSGLYNRLGSVPSDILCLREQILHELILARQLNLDMALTKTATTTSITVRLKAVDSIDSLIEGDKFNIAIKGLAGNALHDNVDGLIIQLTDDSSITAKEGKNLWAVNGIRDLQVC